jgi:hypothetical protein
MTAPHVDGAHDVVDDDVAGLDVDRQVDGLGDVAVGEVRGGRAVLGSRGSVGGGVYRNAPMAGRSPLRQALSASSAAPRRALPVIQLSRDADAEPESPVVAVSDQVG